MKFSVFNSREASFVGGLKAATAMAACLGVVAVGTGSANAQDAAVEEDATARLGTVTVTARKTEENLQTTPVAVTALDASALETRQVVDVKAIEMNAPNVFIQPSGGSATIAFGIRGQNQSENTAAADPAVGLYIDGVYAARSGAAYSKLIDIAGVEVLRGTQGTLFGRNTTGGAVTITSRTPTNELEGSLKVRAGNFDTLGVEGVLNVPIVDEQVALRLVGARSESEGYGTSLTTGWEFGAEDEELIRASLSFTPTGSNFDAMLRADYFNKEGSGSVTKLYSANPNFGPLSTGLQAELDALDAADFWDTFGGTMFDGSDPSINLTNAGVSAELNYDFGWGQLKSISAYRTIDNEVNTNIGGVGLVPGAFQISFAQDNEQDSQISQELQLSGSNGALDWIGGLYYFDEANTDAILSSTAKTFNDIDNSSVGAFAQATYAFTDRLRVTGGLRYTEDKREITTQTFLSDAFGGGCTVAPTAADGVTEGNISVDVANCSYTQDVTYDYVSYLLNVDYQFTDDIFGYAKTSRANRAGGFNNRIAANPFQPEEVTDYEVGVKAEFLDSRLRVNAAAFFTDYKQAQRITDALIPATGQVTQLTQNAAEAEIPGFELEINALPFDSLEIGGSVGILEPVYSAYIVPNPRFDPTLPVSATNPDVIDFTDEKFDRTPDYTYSLYATYTRPTSFGEFMTTLNYSYKDEVSFGVTSDPGQALVDGYGLLNARASLHIDELDLDVAIYGQNVLEEEYFNYVLSFYDSLGYTGGGVGAPRTFGIEISKDF